MGVVSGGVLRLIAIPSEFYADLSERALASLPAPSSLFSVLTDPERRALAPPPRLTVSEWADAHRLLSNKESAEPGPWVTARTPYLRGPMDALGRPGVRKVVIVKPAQVGGSEITRNALGYWVKCDPGPALVVFPTEAATKEQMSERVGAMFRSSPSLAEALTGERHDVSDMGIDTVSMAIYVGWAGSPQALASRPCRYVILDEVDKYPAYSGKDASPVSLAEARVRTYGHRAKIVLVSTPTTDTGAIWTAFEGCELQLRYHVPCPREGCGHMQILTRDRFRWVGYPTDPDPSEIEAAGVWYECAACHGRIEESEKDAMSERGEWAATADENGEIPDAAEATSVGFQFSAFVATIGVRWRALIAKWFRVKRDPAKLFEYVTQDLGEPFRDQVAAVKDAALEARKNAGNPRGVVPKWASHLLVTCDTQKDWFYWVARAWGAGERSQLVDVGEARVFGELEALLARKFPIGDTTETMRPAFMLIDAGGGTETDAGGNRTDEVFRWAGKNTPLVVACRGMGGKIDPMMAPDFRDGYHTYTRKGFAGYKVRQISVNTQKFKDVLSTRINHDPEPGKPSLWDLCNEIPGDYFDGLKAEHKIGVRVGQTFVQRWVIRSHGRRNEPWDCEVYQLCAAKIVGAELAPDESKLERERKEIREARAQVAASAPKPSPYATRDGRAYLANWRR